MATINDLYLKYTNKVGRTLESDRYFQYLFEMIQAGDNELLQNYQVMHKVVDERWLGVIEDSLEAINTIIEKPRRFIATKEEVVPVALARKITAESVRHLSQHTQFIASSENGDIQPTRVLNVSTEESYNLYENRFIYHLIQRLVTFIDKRTDVIFWATGDETQNVLSYQSKIDDAYEEIEYKIEMKVKNRQSLAENDNDNMQIFMRIDRVRRMVLTLKNSAFCSIMAGCSKVRSPIQRTNLIMKDPDYRKCYQLWQFLENYDEVGYTIEVQNTALEFDEEYLIQMYTNLITNYTVFKSLIESDSRKLHEAELASKKKVIKPRFLKRIKEEFVDDPNIEDVEIRKVFVQEVTKAQLEAEAALEREIEARKQAEQNLEDMDAQMISLQQQVSNLMMMNQEAEVRAAEEREAKEAALAEAQTAQAEAEGARAEAETARQAQTAAEEAAEAAKQQAADRVEEAKRQADAEIADVRRQTADEIAEANQAAEDRIAEAKRQADAEIAGVKQQASAEIAQVNQAAEEKVAAVRKQADDEIAAVKESADNEIQTAALRVRETRQQAADQIAEAKQQAEEQIAEAKRQAEQQIAEAKRQAAEEIAAGRQQAANEIAETKRQAADEIAEVQKRANLEISAASQEAQNARAQAEQAEQLRQRVEAESNRARAEMEAQVKRTQDDLDQYRQQADADRRQADADRQQAAEQQKQAAEQQTKAQERIASLERRETDLKEQLEEANRSWEELEKRLQDAEQQLEESREKTLAAEEKARANTLSHYIINRLNGRKHRKNDDGDEV